MKYILFITTLISVILLLSGYDSLGWSIMAGTCIVGIGNELFNSGE